MLEKWLGPTITAAMFGEGGWFRVRALATLSVLGITLAMWFQGKELFSLQSEVLFSVLAYYFVLRAAQSRPVSNNVTTTPVTLPETLTPQ